MLVQSQVKELVSSEWEMSDRNLEQRKELDQVANMLFLASACA